MKIINIIDIFKSIYKAHGYKHIRQATKEFRNTLIGMSYMQQLELLFSTSKLTEIAKKINDKIGG